MNKEQYKNKFANTQVSNQKKNRTCWHKGAKNYCEKFHCKCFGCHTND